ncbi:MAG: hypothetical protein QG594_705 [Bacteroidota bacterium]|jgi:hypothetical protein|nr:hypothetical protein [Bacteroidota bacterium]
MERNIEPLKHSKENIIKAIVIVVLFAGCLFLLWNERANSPETGDIKTGEESTLVVKTISETTDYTDIDVQIPQFTNASGVFNKKIEQYVRERITEHKTETAENWQARIDTQGPDGDLPKVPTGDGDKMYFYAKFDAPEQNNNEYISILTRIGGYTGGAHPYEEVLAYNYDVKNKKEVVLADLFPNDPNYLIKISNIARSALIDRFADNLSDGDFDSANERKDYVENTIRAMVNEGTDANKPENFTNFTFNKNELTIHFGQYQVAPYVFGLQDVVILLPLK